MARKKKLLPKDFRDLIREGDLAKLTAVFDTHELDARDGRGGQTALGVYDCPPLLMRWLVEQGLDVDLADQYGHTPLSRHVIVDDAEQVATLLDLGASPGPGPDGVTALRDAVVRHSPGALRVLLGAGADPLEGDDGSLLDAGIRSARNTDLVKLVDVAEQLIAAGVPVTETTRRAVRAAGEEFEFHRAGFNPRMVDEVSAALDQLYALTGTEPAPRLVRHDGSSPITVVGDTFAEQYDHLWSILVPGSGAAPTVQGEVIRIPGRVADELLRNAGGNWDRHYRAMVEAWGRWVRTEVPLSDAELAEAEPILAELRRGGNEDGIDRIQQLAVVWVRANPTPVPLPEVPYRR